MERNKELGRCPVCGLKNCVCDALKEEDLGKLKVSTTSKVHWKRPKGAKTTITGHNGNGKKLLSALKRGLGCGGYQKNNEIVLQGSHEALNEIIGSLRR